MNYHSELWTTRLVLLFSKLLKNKDEQKKIHRGALGDATGVDRSVYFQFGTKVFLDLWRVLAWIAIGVWLAQGIIDPLALPVIPALFNIVMVLLFNIWRKFDRKTKESVLGRVICFTQRDLSRSIYWGLGLGIGLTLGVYGIGIMNVLLPRVGTKPFYGLVPHSGLFGT